MKNEAKPGNVVISFLAELNVENVPSNFYGSNKIVRLISRRKIKRKRIATKGCLKLIALKFQVIALIVKHRTTTFGIIPKKKTSSSNFFICFNLHYAQFNLIGW